MRRILVDYARATALVGEGLVGAAAEEAMSILIERGYMAFRDISSNVVKKSLLFASRKGVKEGFLLVKESLLTPSPTATAAEELFFRLIIS
jgi:hypothetical protein